MIADSLSPRLGVEHNELIEALAESMDERISLEPGVDLEEEAAEISNNPMKNQAPLPPDPEKDELA